MTKTTMPEPVARFTEDFIFIIRHQPNGERWPVGTQLITTDQAEAYAAAKVREALEAAIKAAESCNTSGTIRSGTIDQCVEAIRVLIPA